MPPADESNADPTTAFDTATTEADADQTAATDSTASDTGTADAPTTAEVRSTGALPPEADAPLSDAAIESSTPFVGQWNELVSTTNWEKGRIISDWRSELEKSGAAVTEYSDEAWARLVGGVTSQHVGRLRRAHERFGEVFSQYPSLYWSHFQAALDWADAEMWLEGAITNGWSVSQMRAGRWEAVGDPADEASQVIEGTLDEDGYNALTDRDGSASSDSEAESAERNDASDPTEKGASDSSSDGAVEDTTSSAESAQIDEVSPTADAVPRVQPFKDLAALPDDVAEAFEHFKLAILTHKLTGWQEVSRDDLLNALESLRVLALAPSDND